MKRDFPEWAIGFRDLGQDQSPAERWNWFLDTTGLSTDLAAAGSDVRNIFLAFRDLPSDG